MFPFDSIVQWYVEQLGLGEGFYLPCGLVDFTWYLLATGNFETWDIWLQTWVMDESILNMLLWSCHCPDFKACCLLPAPDLPLVLSVCSRVSPSTWQSCEQPQTVILNKSIGKPIPDAPPVAPAGIFVSVDKQPPDTSHSLLENYLPQNGVKVTFLWECLM